MSMYTCLRNQSNVKATYDLKCLIFISASVLSEYKPKCEMDPDYGIALQTTIVTEILSVEKEHHLFVTF